jgi:hypothetical protein
MRLTRSTILNSLNPFITRTKLYRLCPELLAHEDLAMPTTAITHFREDVGRARAIVDKATGQFKTPTNQIETALDLQFFFTRAADDLDATKPRCLACSAGTCGDWRRA